jgi:hypothetical protein
MGGAYIKCGDGRPVHICGTGIKACAFCRFLAEYQCDYRMGKGKTCDAYLCERHAISQGFAAGNQLRLFDDPDPVTELHFCPAHVAVAKAK